MKTHSQKKEINISYNLYLFKTNFILPGSKDLPEQLNKYTDSPFDETVEDILDELFDIVNEDFIIKFKGRLSEFDELNEEIKYFNKVRKRNIELVKEFELNDIDSLKDIENLFKTIQKGPYDELKTDEVKSSFKNAIEKQEFRIGVIATMKTGKSTFLNSLLYNRILPSKTEACTSKLFYIRDNDNQKGFIAKAFSKDDKEIEKKTNVTRDELNNFNDNEDVEYVEIEANIPGIKTQYKNIVMIDTPGPNNSRDKRHKIVTNDLIDDDKNSLVLYIINTDNISSEDNFSLIKKVSDSMKTKGKKSKERFIFILNKIDGLKPGNDDKLKLIIDGIKDDLSKFEIINAKIFPVSSYFALISRLKLKNIFLHEGEEFDLGNNYFKDILGKDIMEQSPVSISIKEKLLSEFEEAKNDNNSVLQLSIASGIPAIEFYIDSFLEKYSLPLIIRDAINSFQNLVKNLDFKNKVARAINIDENARERLKDNLDRISETIDSGKKAKEYKDKIKDLKLSTTSKTNFDNLDKKVETIKNFYVNFKGLDNWEIDTVNIYLKKLRKELRIFYSEYSAIVRNIYQTDIIDNSNKLYSEYRKYSKSLIAQCVDFTSDNISIEYLFSTEIKPINTFIENITLESTIVKERGPKRFALSPIKLFNWLIGDEDYQYTWTREVEVYKEKDLKDKMQQEFSNLNKNLVIAYNKMEKILKVLISSENFPTFRLKLPTRLFKITHCYLYFST